jgi:hypothetical protein
MHVSTDCFLPFEQVYFACWTILPNMSSQPAGVLMTWMSGPFTVDEAPVTAATGTTMAAYNLTVSSCPPKIPERTKKCEFDHNLATPNPNHQVELSKLRNGAAGIQNQQWLGSSHFHHSF